MGDLVQREVGNTHKIKAAFRRGVMSSKTCNI